MDEMTNGTYKDLSGREIAIGDYICYAALWSRSAHLKYGRVLTLKNEKVGCVAVDRSWKNTWLLDGVVRWDGGPLRPARVNTLSFLDRLLVVTCDQLPDEARILLDEAYEQRSIGR